MIKFKKIRVAYKNIEFTFNNGHFKEKEITFITGKNGSLVLTITPHHIQSCLITSHSICCGI